jgi:hypothetical protein
MYTNTARKDGFGAQYQNIICDIMHVKERNGEYIYTPPNFQTVYEDEALELENAMNIRSGYRAISNISVEQSKNVNVIGISVSYPSFERKMEENLKSPEMEKIRELFAMKNKNPYDGDHTNVAVHIRRCSTHKNIDITSHHGGTDIKNTPTDLLHTVSQRFLPDSYYLSIINEIRSIYKNAIFHIYSEGKEEDFSNFSDRDTVLHINESVIDSFSALVHADILITSPSSFSYCAAFLSRGIIYAKRFWHKNASFWISK